MRFAGIAYIALLAGTAGCGESTPPQPGESCTKHADCGEAGVCNPVTNTCVPFADKTPGLEVWPPMQNNQGWAVQEFPKGTLQADGQLLVQLEASVSVEGRVYASDLDMNNAKKYIPARIVAWRDSLLPGRPKVQFETTVIPAQRNQQNQTQKDTFVLWLNKGHTYSVYVVPLEPYDSLYPPLVTSLKVGGHLKQDFVLDGADRAVEVTGNVLDASNKALGYAVRVRAYKAGGLGQSTIGKTDAGGAFSFRVPAGVATYTIRVESADAKQPVPTMECSGRILGLGSPDQKGTQPIGTLAMPAFRTPERFELTVKGKDGLAVKQATVTFSTSVPAPSATAGFEKCSASYVQSGVTDVEGKVALKLLPGDAGKNRSYSVTVVTPADSTYASQWQPSFEVGAVGGTLAELTLDARYRIKGTVVMDGRKPVAGAMIDAQAIGSGESQSALPPSKASAVADKDGVFELHVDPGIYNIDVRPPEGAGLPAFGLTAKSILGDMEGVLFSVPPAQALHGKVLDPNGRELASAQVTVYDLVPEIEKPLVRKAVMRGLAITNAAGLFSLVVAPSVLAE